MKKTYSFSKLLLAIVPLLLSFSSYSQTIINQEKFETNFGIWTSGGTNVTRETTFPYNGTNSVRFRGTTNMTLTSNVVNALPLNKIDVKFFIASNTNNSGENMILQYRSIATGTWQDVRTFTVASAGDISSSNTYHAFYATLFSTDYTFTSTAQFRFISNLADANRFLYLDNVSILGTTFTTPTKGPGGISANLETWLRADKINGTGVNTDNTPVNTWIDYGKGNSASVIDAESAVFTNKPSFKNNSTNNVNFNPVVFFNNVSSASNVDFTNLTNRAELNSTSGFFSQEQFVVVINENGTTLSSSTLNADVFCGQIQTSNPWDRDVSGIGLGNYTGRIDSEVITYCIGSSPSPNPSNPADRGYGIAQTGTMTYPNFIGIINARNNAAATKQELHLNGQDILVTEVGAAKFANYSNRRFWIGRSQAFNGSFGGRIAEAITFSARKSDANERRRIESYLAIKYGITLGTNGTSLDYQNSTGSVIWSQTGNVGYNFNIAGIGRDDAADLIQKQSRSSNSTAEIAIGLGLVATTNTANTNAFGVDRQYLVWGSNNAALAPTGTATTTVTLGTGITTAFIGAQRKYKIVETGGDVAQVVVSLPKASMISTFPKTATQEYVMIVSSTDTFGSAQVIDIVTLEDTGTNFETWYDFDSTKFFTFGVAEASTPKYRLDNGTGDYIVGEKNINLNSAFTVSAWIRTSSSATNGTFIAKNGAYEFYVNTANKVVGNWNGADKIVSNTSVNTGKYHYITFTLSSAGAGKLYIDGVLDKTTTGLATPVSNTNNFSIGAIWSSKGTITNTFIGDIDEVRIWNTELTETQLRYIMNQEILKNGTFTGGVIVPNTITKNDIATISYTNLQAYYDMNTFYGTSVKDKSDNNRYARIKYLNADNVMVGTQTAPLPYSSAQNGAWANTATWANGTVQNLANSPSLVNSSIIVNWNIVQTQHDVTSDGNKTVLALNIVSNRFSEQNDTQMEISHYLKLTGILDLVGESQLIQTLNSDLDVTSSGRMERDQQGTSNKFNYNYWCSPVSMINGSANNTTYSVADVFKDGTTTTPQNITWTYGYNASGGSPLTMSSYWIYKFQSASNAYANWSYAGQNGALNTAQGFTLKGSGAATAEQNYTFVGKPNNGRIQFSMPGNQVNLTGNPYASALDANDFIDDNIGSTTGALYFWDHFGGNTHVLLSYLGGYATYTKMGGVVAMSQPELQNLGPGTKVPKRFVPVGQGFFIRSSSGGGTITFDNNQREFIKENSGNSLMFRNPNQSTSIPEVDHFTDNSEKPQETPDNYTRIRLGYDTKDNYHRQLLLGFANENATSDLDPGYDAICLDTQANDMYFVLGSNNLVIQADGFFNENNIYPLGVKADGQGTVKFMIDAKENLNENQDAFIFDNATNLYHSIKNEAFEISLESGTYDSRFSLRFISDENLGTGDHQLSNGIKVAFTTNNNMLHIKNELLDTTVESATVFSLLGQKLATYSIENQAQQSIQLPISNLSTGTYIVKIQTTNGDLSQKIIIR